MPREDHGSCFSPRQRSGEVQTTWIVSNVAAPGLPSSIGDPVYTSRGNSRHKSTSQSSSHALHSRSMSLPLSHSYINPYSRLEGRNLPIPTRPPPYSSKSTVHPRDVLPSSYELLRPGGACTCKKSRYVRTFHGQPNDN
jgi:hypothetical protein